MAVSNKDVEVLSEALFCYYFAIWKKGKKAKYDSSVWNTITSAGQLSAWTNKLGITSMVKNVNGDSAFTSRLGKVSEFLTKNKGFWSNALISEMDAFFSSSRINLGGGPYFIMRADMIPAAYDPYKLYETISKKVKGAIGFKGTIDKDKWNPSDVWIFTTKSQQFLKKFITLYNNQLFKQPGYSVKMMEKLNNRIYLLFQKGLLFPVSLKAPTGRAKVVFENDTTSDLQKVVRYERIEFDQGNQDAKIKFAVDEVDKQSGKVEKRAYIKGSIKTKTVKSGGARLEIEAGGAARYGSMGTENYQWIIKETDKSGINSLNSIRNKSKFQDLQNKYWTNVTGSEWLGRAKYVKEFNSNPQEFKEEIQPYTQELFRHINGGPWDAKSAEMRARSPEEAWLNKTHAGEVAVAVNDITKQIMKDITTENLFNLAASQGFGSGVSNSQLQIRMNMAKKVGKSLGEDFGEIEVSSSKKLWTSCFYAVVK